MPFRMRLYDSSMPALDLKTTEVEPPQRIKPHPKKPSPWRLAYMDSGRCNPFACHSRPVLCLPSDNPTRERL
jgi:hypothetical protein